MRKAILKFGEFMSIFMSQPAQEVEVPRSKIYLKRRQTVKLFPVFHRFAKNKTMKEIRIICGTFG